MADEICKINLMLFGQATIATEGPGMIPIVILNPGMPLWEAYFRISDVDAKISYPGNNPRSSKTESEDLSPRQRLADKNNKNVSSCITNA